MSLKNGTGKTNAVEHSDVIDLNKWNVGIVSTAKDFGDVRERVGSFLERNGFCPIYFENSDYEIYHEATTRDICLKNVEKMDYVILMINVRYGHVFNKDSGESITHEEYEKAIACGIPVLKIVNKNVHELYELSKGHKNAKFDEKKYNEKMKSIIDSCEGHTDQEELEKVVSFISAISAKEKDNWLIFVNSFEDDFEKKIYKALSWPHVVAKLLLDAQCKYVREMNTISGLTTGKIEEIYVNPPFSTKESRTEDDLPTFVFDRSNEGRNVKIFGEPGSGKTSLLLLSFLKHAKFSRSGRVYPIYFKLSSIDQNINFSKKQIIDRMCKIYLNKGCHPLLNCEHMKISLYIDAVDEAHIFNDSEDIKKFITHISTPIFHSIVLCCRTDRSTILRNEALNGIEIFLENFDEETIEKMLENCVEKNIIRPESSKRVSELLKLYKIKNPLFMSLIISFAGDIIRNGDNSHSVSCLYVEILRALIKRNRDNCNLNVTIDRYTNIVRYTCWKFYSERINRSVMSNYLLREVEDKFGEIKNLRLILKPFLLLPNFPSVSSVHELFVEFFVADWIVNEILSDSEDDKFLEIVFSSQIQRFMGALFIETSQSDLNSIFIWYMKKYDDLKKMDEHHKRTSVLYFIPRLMLGMKGKGRVVDFLNCELRYCEEKNELLELVPILNWLVQLGDIEAEKKYYTLVKDNEKFEKTNRGCYIVYQGDVPPDTTLPDFIVEIDELEKKWPKTFESFMEHFESNDNRHKYIRRVDFLIMRKFIENKYPLTDEMKDKILGIGKLLEEKTLDDAFRREAISNRIDRKKLMEGIRNEYCSLLGALEKPKIEEKLGHKLITVCPTK